MLKPEFHRSSIIKKFAPIWIILGAVIIFSLLLVTRPKQKIKETNDYLPLVEVMQVYPEDITLSIQAYGVVHPKYQSDLVSEVNGRIIEINENFVAGQMVKGEDFLAQVEDIDYQTAYSQAQAELASAQARLEQELAEGKVARKDWQDIMDQKPTALGLRKPQLKQEKANVRYAKASLLRAGRNLNRTTIQAPFDGILKDRAINLGQYVAVGTIIGKIYSTNVAEVRLPLTQEDFNFIEMNPIPPEIAKITTSIGGKIFEWEGKIVRSEGVIDEENRMIYLVAEVPDPYQIEKNFIHNYPLKYGTFVEGYIEGLQLEQVFKLPRYLVQENSVMVIKKDDTVEKRKVRVLRSDTDFSYISEGLQAGDFVSITQLENMMPGTKVKRLQQPKPQIKPLMH